MLSRIGVSDEAVFEEENMDEGILVTLKQFFQRLDEQGATLRIVQGGRDFMLERKAVSLARQRIEAIRRRAEDCAPLPEPARGSGR